jgi:phytoene dehydrogenase-like protein
MKGSVSPGINKEHQKQVIIIGAGMAGLSAGCYARMNGYETRIYEMHDKPGGLCTSWKRQGYTFDGCIEWTIGSKAGSQVNRIFAELGAVQGRKFIDYDVFHIIEGRNGQTLTLYSDIDRLERHMKEISPGDSAAIEELCNVGRRLTPYVDIVDPSGLLEGIKMTFGMLSFLGILLKYGKITAKEFITRFSDPFLRQALMAFADINGGTSNPVAGLMYMPAAAHMRDAGYPAGGSLEIARAIERRYLDLGGEMHYRSRVEKILVEADPAGRGDRAVGVRLVDGSEHRADIVISAADGHATIFDMLESRYINDKTREYYDKLPIYKSWVQVSLGVARDLSIEAPRVSYWLDEPVDIAGQKVDRIDFRHFYKDPSMAPSGKSVVIVQFNSDHAYWKTLHADPARYESEKKRIAKKVIESLERRLPGISKQVEVIDVSTPMTVERYTGNWQGSQEGWLITPDTIMIMGKGMDKTLPGLTNFYMAGQWVEPGGGVSAAALSGWRVIRMLCRKDRMKFSSNLPSVPQNTQTQQRIPISV